MAFTSERYAFLDIMSEEDALSAGVNLTDKYAHHVYRAIRAFSTPAAISREQYFTADTVVRDLPGLDRRELVATIRRLMADGIVAQALYLENQPGDRALRLRPCFLARHDRTGSLQPVFQQLLHQCERAVRRRIAALPALTAEDFRADLECDLRGSRPPRPDRLKVLAGGLLACIGPDSFDIPPALELLAAVHAYLRETLVADGTCTYLRRFGLSPLAGLSVAERYGLAARYVAQDVAPRYENDPLLRREFEAIATEEAVHLAHGHARTVAFDVRRAGAVQRHNTRSSGREWYSGSLATAHVLALGEAVELAHDEEVARRDSSLLEDLLSAVLPRPDGPAPELLFFGEARWLALPAAVRTALRENGDLLYVTLERPTETLHCFAPGQADSAAVAFRRVFALPEGSCWQVWAAERFLDVYWPRLEALHSNARLKRELHAALLRSSKGLLTWPLRLLLPARRLLEPLLLRSIRAAFIEQQAALRERNRRRRDALAKQDRVRRHHDGRLAAAEVLRSLLESRLEDFLFRERMVPSLQELLGSFTGIDAALLREALSWSEFCLLPCAEAGAESVAVLFPRDQTWPVRALQLRDQLPQIEARAEQAAPARRAALRSRIAALRSHLGLRSAPQPAAPAATQQPKVERGRAQPGELVPEAEGQTILFDSEPGDPADRVRHGA